MLSVLAVGFHTPLVPLTWFVMHGWPCLAGQQLNTVAVPKLNGETQVQYSLHCMFLHAPSCINNSRPALPQPYNTEQDMSKMCEPDTQLQVCIMLASCRIQGAIAWPLGHSTIHE